ncbi:hypothetical protein EVJ58_g3083 [Rhodofomes roseus]|uniref:Uncharacterized protein n=1 Tax=Rhodofomes roseus TaxID=34475 RepID=A0A4Y9YPV6_9APHY|nr:hypothetical protein EVJ58_g3083 [Rhodofomes roseus]
MEPSTVAEQRATAVAKLKRAASLPRMKDGRRPPMHVEAVSEGERMEDDGRADEEMEDESDVRRGVAGGRVGPRAWDRSGGGGEGRGHTATATTRDPSAVGKAVGEHADSLEAEIPLADALTDLQGHEEQGDETLATRQLRQPYKRVFRGRVLSLCARRGCASVTSSSLAYTVSGVYAASFAAARIPAVQARHATTDTSAHAQ